MNSFFSFFRKRTLYISFILIFFFNIPTVKGAEGATKFVDFAFVTWNGASKLDVETSQLRDLIEIDVAPRWRSLSSFTKTDASPKVDFRFGFTHADSIALGSPFPCEGSEASRVMSAIRSRFYSAMNIDNSSERFLVALIPRSECIWLGRAFVGNKNSIGGTLVLNDTLNPFVLAHELGHALGLGHTNLLRCSSGLNDGPWGDDCRAIEYGGAIDLMSNVDVISPISTYGQWSIGLIRDDEVHQSWLSEEIRLGAVDSPGGIRAIFLRDGLSTYWLEFRSTESGANYKPGLVIFRTDPPPLTSILSPNPEDSLGPEFDMDLTKDIWMLNLDDYNYSRSRSSGSMTLPEGRTVQTFSGNLSISWRYADNTDFALVTIVRKPDTTPPPAPILSNPNYWGLPGASIINADYDDGESVITGFELRIFDSITFTPGSATAFAVPTYLHPIMPRKTLYLKDLPEGRYKLAIRGIDVWGNRSGWSQTKEVLIDRDDPITGTDFLFNRITRQSLEISWTGAQDSGSGLCRTTIQNQEGFVYSFSENRESPILRLPREQLLKGYAEIFDCLGNGVEGSFVFSHKNLGVDSMKRTGRWISKESQLGTPVYSCIGRCSASITVKGSVGLEIMKGNPNLFLNGRFVPKTHVFNSDEGKFASIIVGPRTKVLRIAGSNFDLGHLYQGELNVPKVERIARVPILTDESLDDAGQKNLGLLGFNQDDFSNGWQVLPMPRGTTLMDPTLDLCNSNYVSESGRSLRRQVSVTKAKSPYLFLSTEAVRYESDSAAEAALAELKKNYEACVINKGGTENGIFTPYAFQALPKSEAKLVDEKNRVVVRASIGSGTSARQLLAFYQYEGAYFTGLYIVLAGEKPITDSEVIRWFDVAEVMANRLSAKK